MRNILIIKPSSFGDIVQALPAAARLKETWPGAKISWLLNSQYLSLLRNNPCVDEVMLFDRHLWKGDRRLGKALSSFIRLCRSLRRSRYDAVLDLQGLFRSGVLAAATGAGLRAGFANARELSPLFYTLRVSVPAADIHSVDRYLLVPGALGCKGAGVTFPLGVGAAEEAWAEEYMAGAGIHKGGRVVGLSPGARWKSKQWPAGYFAALGDSLSGRAAIMALGGRGGEAKAVAGIMHKPVVLAEGIDDPLRVAALLKRMDVLISNDTGPMHLAAAVGTMVIGLFGPTNPARTGPYGRRHRAICPPVPCRPCYKKECERYDDSCMRLITVESVLGAAEEALDSGPPGR